MTKGLEASKEENESLKRLNSDITATEKNPKAQQEALKKRFEEYKSKKEEDLMKSNNESDPKTSNEDNTKKETSNSDTLDDKKEKVANEQAESKPIVKKSKNKHLTGKALGKIAALVGAGIGTAALVAFVLGPVGSIILNGAVTAAAIYTATKASKGK